MTPHTELRPPTNELGILTLFTERPFWHCPTHWELFVDAESNPWSLAYGCIECWREQEAAEKLVAWETEQQKQEKFIRDLASEIIRRQDHART